MTLNAENILKLADFIEKSDDFNIGIYARCITGHSIRLFGDVAYRALGFNSESSVEDRQYTKLIMPPGYANQPHRYPQARTVATLRRLATDGLPVNWGPEPE